MIELFKDLSFDEATHTYTLHSKKLTPVSSEVGKFYKKFDSEAISSAIAKRQSSTKEEYNRIKTELLNQWNAISKEASALGSLVHKFGEDYLGSDRKILPKSDYEKSIVDFWNTMDDYEVVGVS